MKRIDNAHNARLVDFLKEPRWKARDVELGTWRIPMSILRAHPDLLAQVDAFAKSIPAGSRCAIYGHPALAAPNGVIYCLVRGTALVAFRVSEADVAAAKATRGAVAEAMGPGWVYFDAWTDLDTLRFMSWHNRALEFAAQLEPAVAP